MEASAGFCVRVAPAGNGGERGAPAFVRFVRLLAALGFASTLLGGAAGARAASVTLIERQVSVNASATSSIVSGANINDFDEQRLVLPAEDLSPADASAAAAISGTAGSNVATTEANASARSDVDLDGATGSLRVLSGSIDGSAAATCTGPTRAITGLVSASGVGATLVDFRTTVPTSFAFAASVVPSTPRSTASDWRIISFDSQGSGFGGALSRSFDPNPSPVNEVGTLEPGTYRLFLTLRSEFRLTAGCPDAEEAGGGLTYALRLTPEEPVGETIRWASPAGGSFEEPSNWQPPKVPGPEDVAVFDLPTAGYAVTSVAPRPRRLLVRNGQVEHRTGIREVVSLTAAPDEPSIAVGDGGTLQITGGELTSLHTVIGDQGAAPATVDVLNEGTSWDDRGRLTVGGAAPGRLFVVGGSIGSREMRIGDQAEGELVMLGGQVLPGALLVGNGAPGTLVVEEGGAVVHLSRGDEPATIGLSAISEGTVRIVGGIEAPSRWDLDENPLTVGEGGRGELAIESGGIVSSALVVLGADEGAEGLVVVEGTNAANKSVLFVEGALLVGGVDTVAEPGGSGVVEVANGALLIAPNLPEVEVVQPIPTVVIGASGPGRVTVRGTTGGGDPSFLKARSLRVGLRANGRLDVVDGGDVTAEDVRVGAFNDEGGGAGSVLIAGGGGGRQSVVVTEDLGIFRGTVTLLGGGLFVDKSLRVGQEGVLEGFGTVSASRVVGAGRISPSLARALSPRSGGGTAGGRGGAAAEALVVEGDVVMEPGGVIEIPASAGVVVALQVTGALTLDGTLEVAITRGALPQAGDVLGRIEAGSLSGSFRELRVRGVAGLAFRFDPATGALIALTDALPCGAPDRDGDGVADCAGAVAGFEGLGVLDGDLASAAAAISGDGAAVVGASSGAGGERPFRWTRAGGLLALDDPACAGDSCVRLDFAAALSGDGAVVAGGGILSPGGAAVAARWSEAGGAEALRDAAIAIAGEAAAISADATRIAGTRPGGAFLVTPSGVDPLGDFTALALSADGAVAVGTRGAPPADARCADAGLGAEPVRRAAAGGVASLGNLRSAGGCGAAFATSGAGAVVVGASLADDGVQAFRWTAAGGLLALGDLPDGAVHSVANGVSADGAIVVGYGTSATGTEAFVWDATHGMRRLADVLTEIGVDLSGWTLRTATGVSANGRAIAGEGPSPTHPAGEAWRALLVPEPGAEALALAAMVALAAVRRRAGARGPASPPA